LPTPAGLTEFTAPALQKRWIERVEPGHGLRHIHGSEAIPTSSGNDCRQDQPSQTPMAMSVPFRTEEPPAQLSARHTGSPHGTPPCLPLRLIRHRRRRSVRVSMCRSEQTPFEPVAYPANHFGPTRWPRRASIAAGMDHRTISAMRRGAIGSALACCPQPPVFAVSNAGSASSSHQCSRLGKGPIVATRSTP